MTKLSNRCYRIWLEIEETDRTQGIEKRELDRIELASFHTLEEALTYRYEISQKHSPRITGEAEAIRELTAPDCFTAGD